MDPWAECQAVCGWNSVELPGFWWVNLYNMLLMLNLNTHRKDGIEGVHKMCFYTRVLINNPTSVPVEQFL